MDIFLTYRNRLKQSNTICVFIKIKLWNFFKINLRITFWRTVSAPHRQQQRWRYRRRWPRKWSTRKYTQNINRNNWFDSYIEYFPVWPDWHQHSAKLFLLDQNWLSSCLLADRDTHVVDDLYWAFDWSGITHLHRVYSYLFIHYFSRIFSISLPFAHPESQNHVNTCCQHTILLLSCLFHSNGKHSYRISFIIAVWKIHD